jgi:hypothetical protein
MTYFLHPKADDCSKRRQEWESVVSDQIKGDWRSRKEFVPALADLDHHLEAKALYVCTMAKRFIAAIWYVGHNTNWHFSYVQNYSLAFPMIELIGRATCPKSMLSPTPNQRLVVGLYWLNDPLVPPHLPQSIIDDAKLAPHDQTRLESLSDLTQSTPTVGNLIMIRSYLLHGVSSKDKDFDYRWMSYQHPRAMAIRTEAGLRKYWKLLCDDQAQDDSWIDRLSRADINPFPIPGSKAVGPSFELCLIDPDIVDYLEDNQRSIFEENRSNGSAKP